MGMANLEPDAIDRRDGVPQGNWQDRVNKIYETMREMSLHTDPQEMVRNYGRRMSEFFPIDARVSLSRRGLEGKQYRITRFTGWKEDINPWEEKDRLPILEGGVLGALIFGDRPIILDDFTVDPDDPGAEYLAGNRSLMAIPMLDKGVAVNMVVLMRKEPFAFDRERFAENVWLANLFGRATQNLVLSGEVKRAYEDLDRELRLVASIQRGLLPTAMPEISSLKLAAHYETSQRAGGDYYDFFPLPDGKWGILIADVSGHGTPAAVVMAITHSIAHLYPGTSSAPSEMLTFVNQHLSKRYTGQIDSFVTAFYGVYDPESRELTYSIAGHNPPRMTRCGATNVRAIDGEAGLPLGISSEEVYPDHVRRLRPGDRVIFYTDGIVDAQNRRGDLFGLTGLDRVLQCTCDCNADEVIQAILGEVAKFSGGQLATDDRTLVVATVR
ncbi:Phosphoserine phosphatase RsbU [Planctomycetes bacterium Pan216]|uniref:Phosphoserine phosphatase RsbU n=1 Tax=Kolteria novifilia TaxID=2527975 RepID=A0A518AZ20_9BACT|nr:Phosphoserine phosphatase RsbU [Planctomycetes bacterium Pan216]